MGTASARGGEGEHYNSRARVNHTAIYLGEYGDSNLMVVRLMDILLSSLIGPSCKRCSLWLAAGHPKEIILVTVTNDDALQQARNALGDFVAPITVARGKIISNGAARVYPAARGQTRFDARVWKYRGLRKPQRA